MFCITSDLVIPLTEMYPKEIILVICKFNNRDIHGSVIITVKQFQPFVGTTKCLNSELLRNYLMTNHGHDVS